MPMIDPNAAGVFGFHQVIFDFDGVVIDSAGMKTQAFGAVYADEAAEDVARVTRYQEAHGGIGRRDKFRYFEREIFGREASPDRIDALCARFADIVDAGMRSAVFIPGAEAFIDWAAERARLHVVTGMPEQDAVRVCRERGIADRFDRIIGVPTSKLDGFRAILSAPDPIPAARTLAIGDSTTEYEAALATEMPFLAIVAPGAPDHFPAGLPRVEDFSDRDAIAGALSGLASF